MNVAEIQEKHLQKIVEYKQLLTSGDLSESEYNELVQDLMDSDKIIGLLDDEEDIIHIGQIVEVLGAVAKVM
jgi:polyhydroxyalkanoate synthesis regulator phasin